MSETNRQRSFSNTPVKTTATTLTRDQVNFSAVMAASGDKKLSKRDSSSNSNKHLLDMMTDHT